MKNKEFTNDKNKFPDVVLYKCVCGLTVTLDVSHGPMGVQMECPDLECARIYQFSYLGRKPLPHVVREPQLRLVGKAD